MLYNTRVAPKPVFTGIVEGTGTVKEITASPSEKRSAIRMTVDLGRHAEGLETGQSVAINGVCLTATRMVDQNRCAFEMIGETMERTSLGDLRVGDAVNIERSLKVGERLEGHFVLGHVDGVATISRIERGEDEVRVWLDIPSELARYIVKKGSIAVDGISLTVAEILPGEATSVGAMICLIPHTVQVTNMASRKPGDRLNIETDILGKYIVGTNGQ